jgi:hypothetical protein
MHEKRPLNSAYALPRQNKSGLYVSRKLPRTLKNRLDDVTTGPKGILKKTLSLGVCRTNSFLQETKGEK